MKSFDASSFLSAAGKLKVSFIHPDESGLEAGLWVQELTGSQREEAQRIAGAKMKILKDGTQEIDMGSMKRNAMATLASMALAVPVHPDSIQWDDNGSPLGAGDVECKAMFKKNEAPKLFHLAASTLDVISKRVREISGLTDDSLDEKKES